nr:coenzyme F420-0:L-glutamate ligase [Candidatus Njordarchaeota archaeon]
MLELFPIHTDMIVMNDDVTGRILEGLEKEGLRVEDNDILAITSKVISVSEGRVIELSKVVPSRKAYRMSNKYHIIAEICELIMSEADAVIGGIDRVMLTLKNNVLMANAGIDKKNAGPGKVVLHPTNSPKAAEQIRKKVLETIGKRIGVIITDSRTQPLRIGTIGIALGVSGFEPIIDERGKPDLFGRPLQVTRRALADELATAAEILMGETSERVPAVLIRGAPVTLDDNTTPPRKFHVSPDECFYTRILSTWRKACRTRIGRK